MDLKLSSQLHPTSSFDQTVDFNNHLFSSIVTLYILVFLYFPTIFLNIVFSPVFVSTGVLLIYLLRLGAIQGTRKEFYSAETLQTNDSIDKTKQNTRYETGSEESKMHADVVSTTKNSGPSNNETYTWDSCDFKFGNSENSFVEWNVKAPLEIIYEDDEEEDDDGDESENRFKGIERYPSLSLYYPESDTDCSSDDDFAMDMNWESAESASAANFRWGEMGEELIEIALDGKRRSQFFNDEEDSLIEIDISPGRKNEFAGQY